MKNFEHIRPSATEMNNLNIQTLKNYPNRQSPIGNNLSPEELKKRFDAQSEYLRDKLSELVNTLQAADITERLKTGAEQTLAEKLLALTTQFTNYKTAAEYASQTNGAEGARLIGAKKKTDNSFATLQTLLDDIYTLISNLETKVGSDSVASVATDISKAILALKALIDNVYTKSQTYTKTEINTQQTAQDNRLTSLETKQGAENISAVASNISKAILSLSEDIDSLQKGVMPRHLLGRIEYDTFAGELTEELKTLLTAKVLEVKHREPNNEDAVQVLDIGDPDKDFLYTYYYWTSGAGTSEFDGWYLTASALTQTVENEPSYTLNFTNMLWELGGDNLYHIIRTAEQHGIGGDNTIDVDLLKLVDGSYEPISTFTVGSTGTVDIYTDEVFEGTLCIRTGKAYRVPTLVVNKSQIDGLEDDLTQLNTELNLKANLASPALTGNPTAPTPTISTGIANKAYVDSMVIRQPDKAYVLYHATAGANNLYLSAATYEHNYAVAGAYLITISGTTVDWGDGTSGTVDFTGGFKINAQADKDKYIEVHLGTNCAVIGSRAFYECNSLTSITIPDSVTSIGRDAFQFCRKLTSVTIPNSVISIGNAAFYGCRGLTSVTIPNSVISIGNGAFDGCRGLTSVTIPDSVTSIDNQAFYGCSGLTSITIPDSVTSIGEYAFEGCSGLTSINFMGSTLPTIGSSAFEGCRIADIIAKTSSLADSAASAITDAGGILFTNYRKLY